MELKAEVCRLQALGYTFDLAADLRAQVIAAQLHYMAGLVGAKTNKA